MKKSLLGLLLLSAVGAHAQSSVQIYGQMDYGYHNNEWKDDTNKYKDYGIKPGNSAGNYLGFKGTEDLGNGNAANFVLEMKTPTETDGASLRKAYIGLNTQVGSLTIGQQEHAFNEALSANETLKGANIAGSISAISTHPTYTPMVRYTLSSDVATFTVGAGTQKDDWAEKEGKKFNRFEEVGLKLHSSGSNLGLNYFQDKKDGSIGKSKILLVTASHDFGMVVPSYAYIRKNGPMGINEKITDNPPYATHSVGNYHELGFTVPVNKVSLHANYLTGRIHGTKDDNQANFTRSLHGYQIGAKYNFSKRTNAYALYGTNTYESFKGDKGFRGDDIKNTTYSIGLKHSF